MIHTLVFKELKDEWPLGSFRLGMQLDQEVTYRTAQSRPLESRRTSH